MFSQFPPFLLPSPSLSFLSAGGILPVGLRLILQGCLEMRLIIISKLLRNGEEGLDGHKFP